MKDDFPKWYEFKRWYQFAKETRWNPLENPQISERLSIMKQNPMFSDEEIDYIIKRRQLKREKSWMYPLLKKIGWYP